MISHLFTRGEYGAGEGAHLEQVDKRRPRLEKPVADASRGVGVLGGAHHPLLVLTCALFV